MRGTVEAVCVSPSHSISKPRVKRIVLLAGQGVEGDAHCGTTVKHRSRVQRDPSQPNLRQVHIIHGELLDELRRQDFSVEEGTMGENITTRGIALLELPRGTELRFPSGAVVEVTGLRNPCYQLDDLHHGLMNAVLERDSQGELIRKAGIMGVVVSGGVVAPGDQITVAIPNGEHEALRPV